MNRVKSEKIAALVAFAFLLQAGTAVASNIGHQSTGLSGKRVSVLTKIPDGNAQGVLNWWNGRNYYYLQAGGTSVAYQFGITEGMNVGVYFREYFHTKIDVSSGNGSYQAITGTAAPGTEVKLEIVHAGNGNWFGRIGGLQSSQQNLAMNSFERVSVWVKNQNGNSTHTDDGSYKYFRDMRYDHSTSGTDLFVPTSLWVKYGFDTTISHTGNLGSGGQVGLRAY